MRILIKSLVATALFLSLIQASLADAVLKDQTEKWEIYFDATNNNCFTLHKKIKDNAFSLMTYYNATYSVNLVSTSLVNIKEGINKAVLISGSEKINGEVGYFQLEKSGVIRFFQPTEYFLNAINSNGLLFVQIDNKNYGPFVVGGIKEALPKLSYCREKYVQLEQGEGRPIEKTFPPLDKKIVEVKEGVAHPWSTSDVGTIFKFPNYSVVLSSRTRADGSVTLIVDVTEEGFQTVSFEVPNPEGMNGNIQLTKLQGNNASTVVFTNTTMGGTEIRAVINNTLLNFGVFSNTDGLPTSIDESLFSKLFALPDDRILALKLGDKITTPVRLYTIRDNKKVDVTYDNQYRGYYAKLFNDQANDCWYKLREDITSCTGMLASSAILGVLDPALEALHMGMLTQQIEDKEFSYCDNNNCKKYNSYLEAMVDLLPKWGYVDKVNAKSRKEVEFALKDILNKSFTGSGEYSEGCEEYAVGVSKMKGLRGSAVYVMGGGEQHCLFADSDMIGTAVHSQAICYIEDSIPYVDEVLLAQDGKNLSVGSFSADGSTKLNISKLEECKN